MRFQMFNKFIATVRKFPCVIHRCQFQKLFPSLLKSCMQHVLRSKIKITYVFSGAARISVRGGDILGVGIVGGPGNFRGSGAAGEFSKILKNFLRKLQ